MHQQMSIACVAYQMTHELLYVQPCAEDLFHLLVDG